MAFEKAHFSQVDGKKLQDASCMLGVSVIGQDRYTGESFLAITALFNSTPFKRKIALIGDAIQRYNFAIETGLDPDNLMPLAIKSGKTWLNEHGKELKGFQIIKCLEMLKTEECKSNHDFLKTLYETDHEFRQTVDKTASDYLRRGGNKEEPAVSQEKAKELSVKFFIEELAIIATLAIKESIDYFAYPSKIFPAFEIAIKKIYENNHQQEHSPKCEWLCIRFSKTKKPKELITEQKTDFSTLSCSPNSLPSSDDSSSGSDDDMSSEEEIRNFCMETAKETAIEIAKADLAPEQAKLAGAFLGECFATLFHYPTGNRKKAEFSQQVAIPKNRTSPLLSPKNGYLH